MEKVTEIIKKIMIIYLLSSCKNNNKTEIFYVISEKDVEIK